MATLKAGKGTAERSTATGRHMTMAKATKVATAAVREGRAARVASALSQANRATGLLGRDSGTGRSTKKSTKK